MTLSPFRRRALTLAAVAVALPALLLAGLAVLLTLRVVQSVERDTIRYNSYLGQQVAEAFELELMGQLRSAIGTADKLARDGDPLADITHALATEGRDFNGPHFVPVDDLPGYSLLMAEGQPLVYAPGEASHREQYFCGLLLRDGDGAVIGAGGWWVDPRRFLGKNFDYVLHERMPTNPRLYGGIELTRRASIEVLDAHGQRIARLREPGDLRTSRTEPMQGPFENFNVRVAVSPDSPVVWTGRFLAFELAFIIAMGLVVVIAVAFGYRYTVRQLELAGLKAGFVSNVTHELKTPIAMIRLAVETLEMRRFSSPEEEDKFLGIISRETQRLTQLVENILDFARLEAGRGVFKFARVDVRTLVADAVESLQPRLDHLGFRVEMDLPESLPTTRADPTAITHCVLNLLDNAIKYSRQQREIRVMVGQREGWVEIAVADRGIGIAPGDRKRIFEKFVRLENGLVHDVRGAGLGLSLVDQIMRAHHGRIEVNSTPGEGSTFTLLLPVDRDAPEQEAEEQAPTGT